jgi:hypothetical protein
MFYPVLVFFILSLICGGGVSADVMISSKEDQKRIEVTVYNNNLALVKDTRRLTLSKGEGELRFMDVAAAIMPVSVRAVSLTAGENFMVLEQNYEYDLMDRNKLLDKFVGQKIKLRDQNAYQDRIDVVEAELLSHNNNQPIYQIGGEIFLGHPGIPILPRVPENLIAKPTLMWLYANSYAGEQEMEASYLTQGIGWSADYVLVVDAEDQRGDLSGWVTVDNQSGAEYRDATLKLVAGEVNQVFDGGYFSDDKMVMGSARRSPLSSEMFSEESFFEYHIYDLQRPTTIKDRQTKQISLLDASGVSITKVMEVSAQGWFYTTEYRQEPKQPVMVKLKFTNSPENQLGMPLPKGIVRLYKRDSKGQLQFIGEDRIDHTPRQEDVTLTVGEAFDVAVERRQTDFRRVTTRVTESSWEIKIRNRKEVPVTVSVIEPMNADWTMLDHSHAYEKTDAFTARFDVEAYPDKEVVLTYRVQVRQ